MKTELKQILKQWNFINKRNSIEVAYVSHENQICRLYVNWYKYVTNEAEVIADLTALTEKGKVKEWLLPNDERLKK